MDMGYWHFIRRI